MQFWSFCSAQSCFSQDQRNITGANAGLMQRGKLSSAQHRQRAVQTQEKVHTWSSCAGNFKVQEPKSWENTSAVRQWMAKENRDAKHTLGHKEPTQQGHKWHEYSTWIKRLPKNRHKQWFLQTPHHQKIIAWAVNIDRTLTHVGHEAGQVMKC